MRTHADIINAAGAKVVFETLVRRGFPLEKVSVVQRWRDRDSIPGDYWNAFEEERFASLKELAAYAESRKTALPIPDAAIGAQVSA